MPSTVPWGTASPPESTTITMPQRRTPQTKTDRVTRDARRLQLILRLHQLGDSHAQIADLVDLTPQRVGQIIAAGETAAAPSPRLTPEEKRELRREHAANPAALEWLAHQRTDRRRNGRPMDASYQDND